MFTGLVEALGTVARIAEESQGARLAISAPFVDELVIGESVAINGCCLTVVSKGPDADFQAGPETLRRTNLGELRAGDRVNLERALPANGRLGGHIVQGHVDGVGTVRSRKRDGEWETIWFTAGDLAAQMVSKGSVAVDGVSLTVVDVANDAFSVALIPHTLAATTIGSREVGATVNIETDILGKYVMRMLESWRPLRGNAL
jgi:riboflavin synthase